MGCERLKDFPITITKFNKKLFFFRTQNLVFIKIVNALIYFVANIKSD